MYGVLNTETVCLKLALIINYDFLREKENAPLIREGEKATPTLHLKDMPSNFIIDLLLQLSLLDFDPTKDPVIVSYSRVKSRHRMSMHSGPNAATSSATPALMLGH